MLAGRDGAEGDDAQAAIDEDMLRCL